MLEKIKAAEKISLNLCEGKSAEIILPKKDKLAIEIADSISKVPNICSSGQKSIAKIFNILIGAVCPNEIGEIKEEYFRGDNGKEFYVPFSIIVPTRDSLGWKKGKPVLVLNKDPYFMRATGTVNIANHMWSAACRRDNYRMATKEEIKAFYAMLIASVEFSGKLSNKLVIPKQ